MLVGVWFACASFSFLVHHCQNEDVAIHAASGRTKTRHVRAFSYNSDRSGLATLGPPLSGRSHNTIAGKCMKKLLGSTSSNPVLVIKVMVGGVLTKLFAGR